MRLLEERIRTDGQVKSADILKVDSFLNHQMDVKLFWAMAEEWKRLYAGCGVNKILTIEASGIGIAAVAGLVFDCPVVFAKKGKSRNVSDSVYATQVTSFTHGNVNTVQVSKEHLLPGDRIVAVNMIGTITICIVCILALKLAEGYLADVALIYAMLSFLAVVVLSKIYLGVYLEKKHRGREAKKDA